MNETSLSPAAIESLVSLLLSLPVETVAVADCEHEHSESQGQ
jgi:hypothetical protein